MGPRRLLLLAAAILLLLAPSGAKKKKKGAAKPPRPKAPAMLSRCSACHAVASDLTERLAPYEGRDVPEVQMLELIEGADNLGHNLGHLCNAMKIRWHRVVAPRPLPTPPRLSSGWKQLCAEVCRCSQTIMEKQDAFTEADVRAFPPRAGEALGKWIRTSEARPHRTQFLSCARWNRDGDGGCLCRRRSGRKRRTSCWRGGGGWRSTARR